MGSGVVTQSCAVGGGTPVSIRQLEKAFAQPTICERESGQKLEPLPTLASIIVWSHESSTSAGISVVAWLVCDAPKLCPISWAVKTTVCAVIEVPVSGNRCDRP